MTELLQATPWTTLLLVVLVFGFFPGFVLRLLVLLYPKDDSRRRELIAELYLLGRLERLLFVGEQLETVLFEGLPHRLRAVRNRWKSKRTSRRVNTMKDESQQAESDWFAPVTPPANGPMHEDYWAWRSQYPHYRSRRQNPLTGSLKDKIAQLLATLPQRQRDIVLLRVVHGLSAEETAKAVGTTPGAVRVYQHRALGTLRTAWDTDDSQESA